MKKLLFVLFGLTSLNIYANGCGGEYQPATGTCRIIDSSGRQILYNVGRPQSSNNGYTQSQPSVVNIDVPSKYLALAINLKTGVSGGALDMDSRAAAEKEAIKTCERGGSNAPCKVIVWAGNGCIAIARGNEKKPTLFTASERPGLAEEKALRKCRAAGISGCRLFIPETCSLPKF